MSLLIVSDLHISGPSDPMYHALLGFLKNRVGYRDTVVFAGDVFDLFIGNKPIFLNRYSEFFKALQDASKKQIQFHYIEGNHDFLLNQVFSAIPNMQVHPTEVTLVLDGKKFYIAHGDLVVRSDYGYRLLRLILRSTLMRVFVLMVSGSIAEKIGLWMKTQSSSQKQMSPSELPLNRREYLRKEYRNFSADRLREGYDCVVLGHCHDLDEMGFQIDGRPGQYINVGYPPVHGSFLSWTEGDKKIQRERFA